MQLYIGPILFSQKAIHLKADLKHTLSHLQCIVANKPSNETIFENRIIKQYLKESMKIKTQVKLYHLKI